MLRKRVITALWGIPLLIVAIWFDEPLPWFTVLAVVWGLLAAVEFYRMVGVSRILPLTCFGLIWTLLFIIQPHFDYELLIPVLLTSAVALSLILLVFLPNKEGVFTGWAWTIAGILYVGWLLSLLVELRLQPGTEAFPEAGRNFVFLALFATFGSDTAAYFIGRAIGRHKLAPNISPGKTWEGAIAGLFGAVIISLLFTLNTPLQLPLNYGQAILLGLLISVFGQLGDLAESLLKRNSGVKDSGSLMPGHGGLLDRMDSVVFAGVVVYLYYIFVVG
jgi:phosphatidate cytidylyltransferase